MPYFFDALETPLDDEHLWKRLEEIWRIIRNDLRPLHFETREEALAKTYRKSLDADDMRIDSWFVARFRETDDRENLLHFHDQALRALVETEVGIASRKLTAAFLNQWSVLISCHGFVTAAVMARGDDLQSRRAGDAGGEAVSKDRQRRWFANYFLLAYRGRGTRAQAEDVVENLIKEVVLGTVPLPDGADREFFCDMLQPGTEALRDTYRDNKLSVRVMRQLAQLPTDDLPLLGPKIPLPKVSRS